MFLVPSKYFHWYVKYQLLYCVLYDTQGNIHNRLDQLCDAHRFLYVGQGDESYMFWGLSFNWDDLGSFQSYSVRLVQRIV